MTSFSSDRKRSRRRDAHESSEDESSTVSSPSSQSSQCVATPSDVASTSLDEETARPAWMRYLPKGNIGTPSLSIQSPLPVTENSITKRRIVRVARTNTPANNNTVKSTTETTIVEEATLSSIVPLFADEEETISSCTDQANGNVQSPLRVLLNASKRRRYQSNNVDEAALLVDLFRINKETS